MANCQMSDENNEIAEDQIPTFPDKPVGWSTYLLSFLKGATRRAQIVYDVRLTKEQANQEIHDKRNEANSKWQQLETKGLEDRASNQALAGQVIQNIDETNEHDIHRQKAEMELYKSQHEEKMKKMAEEVEKKIKLLEQDNALNLAKLKNESELHEAQTNRRIAQEAQSQDQEVNSVVADQETIRKVKELANRLEIEKMDQELKEKLKSEEEKRKKIRRKHMQIRNSSSSVPRTRTNDIGNLLARAELGDPTYDVANMDGREDTSRRQGSSSHNSEPSYAGSLHIFR